MLSSSTSKKVVVYRFDREAIQGFVTAAWLGAAGVEVLTPSGAVLQIPYNDVKVVCFVKDFEGVGWRNERRRFASRPKSEGLWVRALFRDQDLLEGIIANDLLKVEPAGYVLVPPDANSNNQRIFVPRTALSEFHVLGVVGSAARSRRARPERAPGQIGLFDSE